MLIDFTEFELETIAAAIVSNSCSVKSINIIKKFNLYIHYTGKYPKSTNIFI